MHESPALAQYFVWDADREFPFASLLKWHCRRSGGNRAVLHIELLVTEQNEHSRLLFAHVAISRGVFRHPRVTKLPDCKVIEF